MIKNKRILITGCAGSIGSELLRQLAPTNKIFGVDINETGFFDLLEEQKSLGYWVHGRVGDIKDKATLEDIFSDFKPEIVFHAAAYKHVTPMEWTPIEAIQTNIIGTYNLIQYAKKYEVKKFVFISTDKAVQSSSIMGATKRVSEIITRNQGQGYVVVRFGNVLGSRGSVIPIWQNQINKGKAITITDPEMERYMMTIEEACNLVIEASEIGKGGEIIILDMGKKIKILDLAKDIVSSMREPVEIKVVGLRPGEQLTEKLMFEEEERIAEKSGKFFIIKQ
jgi:FlaA1/EpsC-like NDP-sugar epimerase